MESQLVVVAVKVLLGRFCEWCCVVFFVEQKTAYEMRISDWSSDVALPILSGGHSRRRHRAHRPLGDAGQRLAGRAAGRGQGPEIGRASCRERVCQYV